VDGLRLPTAPQAHNNRSGQLICYKNRTIPSATDILYVVQNGNMTDAAPAISIMSTTPAI
jgi:hypothetical protein